jgi:hypothetical protein
MNIFALMEKLGDPTEVWISSLKNRATEDGFYLYELHEMGSGMWENGVFVFHTPQDFGKFTYALELFDYVYFEDWEEIDESEDCTALFQHLVRQREKEWTFEDCIHYVSTFKPSCIELIKFGEIRDLIDVSEETFEKCKGIYTSKDELEEVGLNEAEYQIMNKYAKRSVIPPSRNEEGFMEFLRERE